MASTRGPRHRRARNIAALATVIACFAPVTAQVPAAVSPALDQGATINLPAIGSGDISVLGPSTARLRATIDPRHARDGVYFRYGDGTVLDQRTPSITIGADAQPDRDPAGPARSRAGLQLQRPARGRDPGRHDRQQQRAVQHSARAVRQPDDRRHRVEQLEGKKTRCTIVGTNKSNKLVGTKRRDVICGLGGNDKITGRGGNDLILAGKGNDRASGGVGNDRIYGNSGRDRLFGGSACRHVLRQRRQRRRFGGAQQPRLHQRRLRP